jgi:photosynthetic reaction center cytochrome c subunit
LRHRPLSLVKSCLCRMVRIQSLGSRAGVGARQPVWRARAVFSILLFLLFLFTASSFVAGISGRQRRQIRGVPSKQAAHAPTVEIARAATGWNRCKFCHPAEVEGYARTTMAHSLRRAGQEPEGTVEAHGSKITIHSSANGSWQHWENAGESVDYRIEYVIGSGTHASGYLTNIEGHLFQSPVAFYNSRKAYDLAPGYEDLRNPDFTRPVTEECVLCHSGSALFVAGTQNQYREPIFSAEAITCERCHGPVERHLAEPHAGNIVNPAKLEPAARDSVCEQCHLFGVARVLNPGKTFSDFVPGQPLEKTYTVYHDALPPGASAGAFKVISHVEQLALSACARNSGGRLWCGTCHDPHDKPAEPVQYYRARCLACHTAKLAEPHPAQDSDCLSCHMPRRNAKDGGHSAFTDHRIQRRSAPEQELPPGTGIAAWREPSPDLQHRNQGIADIDVGMQRQSPALLIQGYKTLKEVEDRFSGDSDFFKWLGDALLVGKQSKDAEAAFERALQLDPESPVAEAAAAPPYIQAGDDQRAIAHLERALSRDPLYLRAAGTLIGLYQKEGDSAKATALTARVKTAIDLASTPQPAAREVGLNGSQKKAEDVFKNLQVLKAIPADELMPTMEFISSSLGVECGFCHVEEHFEKDDKKPKSTARSMMRMVAAVNKKDFEGQREITCYSCHRGARDPVAVPTIDAGPQNSDVHREPASGKFPTDLPTVSQLLQSYITALGGEAAIEGVTSRIEKGTMSFAGQSVRIEVFSESLEKQPPDMRAAAKQAIVRHLSGGNSSTVFDGQSGWFALPGRAPREIEGADLESLRMDADLEFPLHIREFYPELHVEYPETVLGAEAYALYAERNGQTAAKFYFDEQSGLLVRVVRYAESALGPQPTQVDYADYRSVGRVKIPFRRMLAEPGGRSVEQIEEVQDNVPIDDATFAKPVSRQPRAAAGSQLK